MEINNKKVKPKTVSRPVHVICNGCGQVGAPVRITPGYILIELILWICFIIPGLLYSHYRGKGRYVACGDCKSANISYLNTLAGQNQLLANYSQLLPYAWDTPFIMLNPKNNKAEHIRCSALNQRLLYGESQRSDLILHDEQWVPISTFTTD